LRAFINDEEKLLKTAGELRKKLLQMIAACGGKKRICSANYGPDSMDGFGLKSLIFQSLPAST